MDLILNGKPEGIDPFTEDKFPEYSLEQKLAFDELYAQLPLALEVILYNGGFETGKYKAKYHDRNWKKIN